jgi:hypothetical protein
MPTIRFRKEHSLGRGLGGAYLEQTGEMAARFVSKDVTIRTLTTYDVESKQCKRWAFVSHGRRLAYIGN